MKVAEKEVEFESLEEEYGRLSARFTDLEAMLLRTQVSLEQKQLLRYEQQCNFLPSKEIMTDRPTDRLTNPPTD